MRASAGRGGPQQRGTLLPGRAPHGRRRTGRKKRHFGARSPDGEAQVEQEGAAPGSSGVNSAERGSARCSEVPTQTAPIHASRQQRFGAGHWVLQGEKTDVV